jgi:N-acetylmuramoyl-L-alanine amidase
MMLDMSVDWKIKESRALARNLLHELGKIGFLHTQQVQEAGFVVLKAIEIPAVLLEVGFISNKKEERALNTALHHERIAGSIFRAIVRYCTEKSMCRVNQDANEIYVVRKAESLSLLAARFGTTISAIKRANKLKVDTLLIGQQLVIPGL